MSFHIELLESVVKIIENVCEDKSNITEKELFSLVSIVTQLKEKLETVCNEKKLNEVGSTSYSTSLEPPIYSIENPSPHFDEVPGIKKVKILSKNLKYNESDLDESTSDSIESHQVHRRLSQPSLQQIKEKEYVNNNGPANADSKDLFFNPFKRKSGRSASIYPQQARISMHSHQTPTGLSDEFSPDSDNWKQVSSKSLEDSLCYV